MALKSGRVGIHPSQVDPITGMLINGPAPGSISFEDLSDAEISDPEAGQTLQYNGTKWENVFASISPVTPATLASLQDVMISDPEDGNYLMYDSTNQKWINSGEAPTPTTIDVTVTIYSAVEDLITYTDINGDTETIQLPSNSDHTTATITIDPSGSNITFTSSVAKKPSDLSEPYSKSVMITDATTEIKVMPDNALYWWGYESSNFEDCTSANGWSGTSVQPTHNSRDITLSGGAAAIGSKTAISATKGLCVYQALIGTGYLETVSNKNFNNVVNYKALSSSSIAKDELTITQSSYLTMFVESAAKSMKVHALWYE